jgi:cobalt-precorrin 5A hydrolase/precorrin-3B C17-methyltransferase
VARWRERAWPTGPLPGTVDAAEPAAPGVSVTDRLVALPRPQVCYRPPSLVVGVGASRGASADEIDEAVAAALADAGLSPRSVTAVATATAKADEPGVAAVAERHGVPLATHPAEALAQVDVPHPSEAAADAVGTPSVAEAAALATAGAGDPASAELAVAKTRSRPAQPSDAAMATVAVARRPARGQLVLVSAGPGDEALVAGAARDALASAEIVIGLESYLERVRRWIRPGAEVRPSPIGAETVRAADAVAAARAGARVALVSGGDVGVYAMGSPALEALGDDSDVDVTTVPGVTAAQAAAAALGAPLGHDHCAISLSDLLTPWEVIRRRVKAAAEGDFVVCFYNPRSRERRWQLAEALELLAEHRAPDTPVGLVADAARPAQRARLTTLAKVEPVEVDMRTTVVVGSTRTEIRGGLMVTPRGYR